VRRLRVDWLLLPALLAAASVSAPTTANAQATDEDGRTIFVNAANPDASDNNVGTEALPLKTLTEATAFAANLNARGIPVRILVEASSYRGPTL